MTYSEKKLDRLKNRISRACTTLFAVGMISGTFGLMAAMLECWTGEPYSGLTYATGLTGAALIYAAAYIGKQIEK